MTDIGIRNGSNEESDIINYTINYYNYVKLQRNSEKYANVDLTNPM